MKTYIITCLDKKNSLKKRLANRELHLKYLKSLKNKLILEFENKFELNNFLKNDPYSKVGLFETVNIEIFKRVF